MICERPDHELLTDTVNPLTSTFGVDIGISEEQDHASGSIATETFGETGTNLPDTNPKTAIGLTKPSTSAIPPAAILYLAQAMSNGVVKYGLFNWRDHAVTMSVYTDAIDRHLMALKDGEDVASDSGVHHLAHVMACCAILLDAMECGKLIDNRGIKGPASQMIQRLTVGI